MTGDIRMPRKKAEPGSLTGSKRVKETTAKKATTKAKKAIEAGGNLIKDTVAKTVANPPSLPTISISAPKQNIVNNVTSGIAKVKQGITDVSQARQALEPKGFDGEYSKLDNPKEVFGGLDIPEFDGQKFIPSDLINPSNLEEFQLTEKEEQKALATYAGAGRYLNVLKAGYNHIQKVGEVNQSVQKAYQSVIKGSTEEIKTQETIVNYDIARINLETTIEKRDEAIEKLNQQQVKTLAAVNETNQLIQLVEAKENKREAQIQKTISETEQITSKYLLAESVSVIAPQ